MSATFTEACEVGFTNAVQFRSGHI